MMKIYNDPNRIFDTTADAKKIFVSLKTYFTPRAYKNIEGLSRLYLFASKDGVRKRIALDAYVPKKYWCDKKQRVLLEEKRWHDVNLIIEQYQTKITEIKIQYRLSERILELNAFVEEFISGTPRTNFYLFGEWLLEKQKGTLAKGTIQKQFYFLQKMKRFQKTLFFTEINHDYIIRFRRYLFNIGNNRTTVSSNISTLKKFLNAAEKHGIILAVNPDNIIPGSTTGSRTDLSKTEVQKLTSLYQSEFLAEHLKLILGYFLFSCFTGLRISEILSLSREDFQEDSFEFYEKKKKRNRRMNINKSVRMLLSTDPRLFVEKKSDIYMNRKIKEAVKICGIKKHVSFHVGRHTFATNFLRAGGDVISLQKLLGHSNIRQTMEYVHIVEQESNEKVFLIDKLFE